MNIVILGGSGFIGRNLSGRLAELGHQVYSVSRSPSRLRFSNIHYINCNYDNIYQLGDIYQKANFIFHFASDTTPSTSAQQPSIEVTANLLPTLRFLEYMEHYCNAPLIYTSSGGTIYGASSESPHKESSKISPISYYGASKGAVELFLQAYQHQTKNTVYILRPANIYGPGQFAKRQFGIIPTLFDCVKSSSPFNVWGNGEAIRDYLYIDDFTNLCIKLITSHRTPKGVSTYNAGTGKGYSINDLINVVNKVSGNKITIQRHEARSIDVDKAILDPTSAGIDFDWSPQYDLLRGIENTWKWFCENS